MLDQEVLRAPILLRVPYIHLHTDRYYSLRVRSSFPGSTELLVGKFLPRQENRGRASSLTVPTLQQGLRQLLARQKQLRSQCTGVGRDPLRHLRASCELKCDSFCYEGGTWFVKFSLKDYVYLNRANNLFIAHMIHLPQLWWCNYINTIMADMETGKQRSHIWFVFMIIKAFVSTNLIIIVSQFASFYEAF